MQQSVQRGVTGVVGFTFGEHRFHLDGRQLGTEATDGIEDPLAEQPTEDIEEIEEQTTQTPPRRRSGRTRAQVTPRPEGQRRGGRPPPRARGHPLVEHFDLRGATTRHVQALRFVEVSRWFPPQWDPRASEGFYTPLHEDFYRAYIDSGIPFRPQRVYQLEALVEVVGEQFRPHLSFLPGLSDFLGRTRAYCGTWVREFYSSLWIDPAHEFIHFAF
jgi:hypothetical protein